MVNVAARSRDTAGCGVFVIANVALTLLGSIVVLTV